jgi:hypothetical protein
LVRFGDQYTTDASDLESTLAAAFGEKSILLQEQQWNAGRDTIVDGIRSLVSNFPPSRGDRYTPSDIRAFMQMVGYQQIVLLGGGAFAEEMMSKGAAVDLEAFPSIKASLYTVFHKFYVDRSRKLLQSDAFDIIISSAAPYVDTIFTENHQAEVLRKTQKLDNFVQNLSIYTVSDLRGLPPATTAVVCHLISDRSAPVDG